MGALSILVADPVAAARLGVAMGQGTQVASHDSWLDFMERVSELKPDALILDPLHPEGPNELGVALEAAGTHGFGVVVCTTGDQRVRELYDLGASGVGGVIMCPETANRAMVRKEVERAISAATTSEVLALLPDTMSPLARATIRWSIRNATEGASVAGLSHELGWSRETARKRLRDVGLPSPKRILMWGRLFFAAQHLSRSNQSIEKLAHRLGYASRSSLTRMVARELGAPPMALTGDRALRRAVRRFRREVSLG